MIRPIRISITLIAAALLAALLAVGVARAADPTPPSVKAAPAAGAATTADELRRTVDEMRNDMRELRRDVVKLRELLEGRAIEYTGRYTPAQKAEFAGLVEEYNKLVKQDRWAEAELIAKQTKELAGRSEQVSMSAMATIMYEKARIGRQIARNAEFKADETPAPPECTITGLDAAARLQAAEIHFFPNRPASEQVENEMDVLKLAKASRLWSEVVRLKQSGKTEEFLAGCRRFSQAFPESDYAHLALDELAMSASGRSSPAAAMTPSALTANHQSLMAALKKPVSFHLNKVSLIEFAAALQKQADSNVVLDNAGLDEVGIGLKTPISISADHIPLADVLYRVLEPLRLDYVLRNEVLVISSRSRCRPLLEVRAYPVADLVTDSNTASGAKVDFEPLTKLITSNVDPASWQSFGGRGSIQPFESKLSLVIRQSAAGHRSTGRLLQNLRSMNGDVSLTTIIIDQSAAEPPARELEPVITPLSEQEVRELVESTHGTPWTVQRTKLTLRFGDLATLALLTPPSGESRNEAITFESAISADRKRVGLSVGICDLATGKPTVTNIETSIRNHQAVRIALKGRHQLLIVRPEIGDEQEETLTRP
jgi:TolA-binding protein